MAKPRLPIGIQSFQELRSGGYAYVDKTAFIEKLVDGKYYFLSRPRRFGKSLLIDTLDCLFSGRKALFEGLHIYDKWDWEDTNPVLRIDWSISDIRTPDDLPRAIQDLVQNWAENFSIPLRGSDPGMRFYNFVSDLVKSAQRKAVILIDEYDKPILDNIEDPEIAAQIRHILKGFYGTIKPLDQHLRFVFLTGVSKFAKAGIFSGLNNLNDITIDSKYSALCGYTQENLETVFSEYLKDYDTEAVRDWYNGYSWTGERVYNPFDILLLFEKEIFQPYWFETGTPSFLAKLWKRSPRFPADLDDFSAMDDLLGSYDVDKLNIETLLFQSGYLTILSYISNPEIGTIYKVGYPNREVRQSLNAFLLNEAMTPPALDIPSRKLALYEIMNNRNQEALKKWLFSFLASIPHDWYRNNRIADYEGYYAGLIYALFASLGFDIVAEDSTNKGRMDLTVKHKKAIWIFEVKVEGGDRSGDKKPLEQIKERGYADKYRGSGLPIFQIGIVFDRQQRQLVSWEAEVSQGRS